MLSCIGRRRKIFPHCTQELSYSEQGEPFTIKAGEEGISIEPPAGVDVPPFVEGFQGRGVAVSENDYVVAFGQFLSGEALQAVDESLGGFSAVVATHPGCPSGESNSKVRVQHSVETLCRAIPQDRTEDEVSPIPWYLVIPVSDIEAESVPLPLEVTWVRFNTELFTEEAPVTEVVVSNQVVYSDSTVPQGS